MKKFAKGLGVLAAAVALQASLVPATQAAVKAKVVHSKNVQTKTTAQTAIVVKLDGKVLKFPQAPVIKNDRALVPLRGIFESLGAAVKWDAKTKSVTATKEKVQMKLVIGSAKATVNGKAVVLDSAAALVNGNTMVPVRFVSQTFGNDVKWDAKTRTIAIASVSVAPAQPKPDAPTSAPTVPAGDQSQPTPATNPQPSSTDTTLQSVVDIQ